MLFNINSGISYALLTVLDHVLGIQSFLIPPVSGMVWSGFRKVCLNFSEVFLTPPPPLHALHALDALHAVHAFYALHALHAQHWGRRADELIGTLLGFC